MITIVKEEFFAGKQVSLGIKSDSMDTIDEQNSAETIWIRPRMVDKPGFIS